MLPALAFPVIVVIICRSMMSLGAGVPHAGWIGRLRCVGHVLQDWNRRSRQETATHVPLPLAPREVRCLVRCFRFVSDPKSVGSTGVFRRGGLLHRIVVLL